MATVVAHSLDSTLAPYNTSTLTFNALTPLHQVALRSLKRASTLTLRPREGEKVRRLDSILHCSESIIPPSFITNNPSTRCFAPGPQRDILHAHSPKTLKELHVETNEGHMDVMRGHLVLFTSPLMIADFSGKPDYGCSPKKIVFADPPNGCSILLNDIDYERHENAYVLAERGGCTFSAKGANAESVNAAGLIIVNSDKRR